METNETLELANQLPDKLKKFNWGAFLLTWIWGLGNKTYIALLVFPLALLGVIPVLGYVAQLAFSIWLGIKGNELAWKNKEWQSIEHFNKIQKRWATAGVIVLLLMLLFAFGVGILAVVMAD